ncbi:hypothetical protein [Actinoplanes regularis]|uniref:hypothetical protein n=1 Tax=Actinoplanes regularis TaxID=52697 RepID=UPI001A38D613|nr:hypothetical protein [Actinoplanes regularis]GIE88101.1 hypothetical protein Are01nite_45810 [Actinoplanes regularis]
MTVTNNGTKAHNWKATVTYKPSSYSVTGGPWNAKPAAFNGNQIELVGTSSLSGKSSITAGFAGRKGAKGSAQPTGCSVVATAG